MEERTDSQPDIYTLYRPKAISHSCAFLLHSSKTMHASLSRWSAVYEGSQMLAGVRSTGLYASTITGRRRREG
jgi:hypothetical protein